MALAPDYAAVDERLLAPPEKQGYWESLPEPEKAAMRAALATMQSSCAEREGLRNAIHTIAFQEQSMLEDQLQQSKSHYPSDIAARMDEHIRGKLAALGDVAAMLTQTETQNDIINQMDEKEE